MKTLVLALTLLISSSLFAGEKVNITVKGMVCSFCSQGITKKFKEVSSVKEVKVDLDKHLVSLELQDNQKLEDESITKILTDSGYAVEKIAR